MDIMKVMQRPVQILNMQMIKSKPTLLINLKRFIIYFWYAENNIILLAAMKNMIKWH